MPEGITAACLASLYINTQGEMVDTALDDSSNNTMLYFSDVLRDSVFVGDNSTDDNSTTINLPRKLSLFPF